MAETTLQFALRYGSLGLYPIPVPAREKGPTAAGWQKQRLATAAEIEAVFGNGLVNIGILLGEPYNLADVDIDCREALWAWPHFAPETDWVHGRPSKPASHAFYYPEPAVLTARYRDPLAKDDTKACLIELRAAAANGKIGLQTIVPPSIHPSGETIEFARGHYGIPGKVDGGELERAVRWTAACCLLGRYAPGQGARHDYFLAIAGALAHAKAEINDAVKVVSAVYQILWGTKARLEDARREVESTYQRYDDGGETTGLTRLLQILDAHVMRPVAQWLKLARPAGTNLKQQRPAAQVKPIPPVYSLDDTAEMQIAKPDHLIQGILIKPGLTLLVAPPKAGKTILGVQMAMSLASGLHLFDFYSTRQANVLVVEQDDPQGLAAMQTFREKNRAAKKGAPFHFITGCDFVLGSDRFLGWLQKEVREHQIGFLFLDSYTTLRGPRAGGGDVVKIESSELLALAEVTRELGCATLMNHHVSKTAAGSSDWTNRTAGSFAVGAAADTIVSLERFPQLEDDRTRLVRIRGRQLEDNQLVLRFQPETLDFDWVMEGPASEAYPSIRLLHLAFPGERPFTAKEAGPELGLAHSATYRLLSRLTHHTVLRKTGDTWTWGPNSPFRVQAEHQEGP